MRYDYKKGKNKGPSYRTPDWFKHKVKQTELNKNVYFNSLRRRQFGFR